MVVAQARLPTIGGTQLTIAFLVALAVVAAAQWWLSRTTFGYELRMVGANPRFARAQGIDIARIVIVAMVLSGALGGLAGSTFTLGTLGRFVDGAGANLGFNGIAVALLGRLHPLGALVAALALGALAAAGPTVQLFIDVPLDVIRIMQGTIMIAAVIPLVRRAPRTQAIDVRRRRAPAPSIMLAPVLVFTALGGVVHQRSGVVDIALEGFILIGSFVGIIAANAAASGTLGLGAGMLAGAVVGWLFSFIVSRLGANMIIVGLGVNTVLFGLTGLILAERYGSRSAFRPDADIDLPSFGLGFLADVPVLGPLLASNDVVVWAMVPAVVAVSWACCARAGDCASGPPAAMPGRRRPWASPVPRVRLGAGTIAGALAGLGGAHLSIAVAGLFSPGISAGRGYIALAAVYFGRARPVPTSSPRRSTSSSTPPRSASSCASPRSPCSWSRRCRTSPSSSP